MRRPSPDGAMPWLDQSELSVQPQLEQASAVLVNAALAASSVAQVRDWGNVFMKFSVVVV